MFLESLWSKTIFKMICNIVTEKFAWINKEKYEHQKSVLVFRVCLKGNIWN